MICHGPNAPSDIDNFIRLISCKIATYCWYSISLKDMRAILFLWLGFILISGCSSDNTSETVASNMEQADSDPLEEIVYSDTIRSFTDVGDFEFNGPSTYDTSITIEGKTYRLHLECELLKNQRVKEVDKYESEGILYVNTIVGYQARYRFALFQGEKLLFNRTLKKEDLKESCYPLVLQSDACLPDFVSYNKAFKSLVFHIPIHLNESCWSANALVVIDMNGNVKFVDELSEGGGNHSNYEVQFTPGNQHMISSAKIHHASGKKINLDNKSTRILGVDIFDECLFTVYEYDAKKHPKNAYIVDYEGKTHLNFHYQCVGGGMGYHFPREFVNGNYYFFDEENKRLIKLKKGKSWSYQFLPFSGMKEFDGEIRSGEIPFTVQTEIHDYAFFLDTRSNKLRKTTPIEYY